MFHNTNDKTHSLFRTSTNGSIQGGSVIREFLKEPEKYHIRGLTRNTTSPKSKALAGQGVEMVQADLDDAESLAAAFTGAHIIYAMTDFWQSMSAEIETDQGKRIVNAAENLPQLEHFVWASLPDGKALSQGQFSNIFHWQSKADVAKYMRDSKPALWSKTIEILFPNYMENCVTNAPVYLPVKVSGPLSRCFVLRCADLNRSTRMERTCVLSSSQARRLCPTLQFQTPASW
jgi:hypothetical protein